MTSDSLISVNDEGDFMVLQSLGMMMQLWRFHFAHGILFHCLVF